MNELSKLILKEYQTRRTKKQKLKFIELLKRYIPNLKVEEGGFLHNRNIVVGDVERAKVVIGAHYDTCALLPIPNLIMPKRIILSLLYPFILVVPIFILTFLSSYILSSIIDDINIVFLVDYLITIIILMFIIKVGL